MMKKALWLWKIKDIFGGDPLKIAATAVQAGFSDVFIKMADGGNLYNLSDVTDPATRKTVKKDLVPALVEALRAVGVRVWGWQYLYSGSDLELAAAGKRIDEFKLDGWILDAEGEFKAEPACSRARSFLQKFRARYPAIDLAFSSFRFPAYHREFPWKDFATYCNINMPQVYWEGAHNPGSQLRTALDQHIQFCGKGVRFLPVGAAYNVGQWRPTTADITDFLKTAKSLAVELVSFWSWDELANRTAELWAPIITFEAPAPKPTEPPKAPIDEIETRITRLAQRVSELGQAVKDLAACLQAKGLF